MVSQQLTVTPHRHQTLGRMGQEKAQVNTFDSLNELLRHASQPVDDGNIEKNRMSRARGRRAFNSTTSFDKAAQLARGGWKEGVKRVYTMRERLIAEVGVPGLEFTPRFDVAGSEVDMERFLSGHPEHMVDAPLDYQDKKDILFTVDTNIACGACVYRACQMVPIPVDSTFMRGAALSMVAEALEKQGHRVGVKLQAATWFTQGRAQYLNGRGGQPTALSTRDEEPRLVVNEVWLKRPAQYLDLNRLIFGTAHTDMMQRLEFGATEQQRYREGMNAHMYFNGWGSSRTHNSEESGTYHSYGRWYLGEITPVPKELRASERGGIHIDNLQRQGFRSETQMLNWLFGVLETEGIEVVQR